MPKASLTAPDAQKCLLKAYERFLRGFLVWNGVEDGQPD